MEGDVDEPLPLGWLAGLLALVNPEHPERERLPNRATRKSANHSLVRGERQALNIWLRLRFKLRAQMQHAPLATLDTGAPL
jgi:hypothetical protein